MTVLIKPIQKLDLKKIRNYAVFLTNEFDLKSLKKNFSTQELSKIDEIFIFIGKFHYFKVNFNSRFITIEAQFHLASPKFLYVFND